MDPYFGIFITLAGHLAVTVWWASRMDASVKHLVQSVDTLVKQGVIHNTLLSDHATRLAVLEAKDRTNHD